MSWNLEIRADKVMKARRPDIVLIDKTKRTTTIIDVTVPPNWKIKDKEDLKISLPKNRNKVIMEYKSKSYANHSGITGSNFDEFRETS